MTLYYIYILMSFLLSALSGFILIPQIQKFCFKRGLLDQPNARKVHNIAVPRLGGMAFIPCMCLAFVVTLSLLYYEQGHRHLNISLWSAMFMVSLIMIYAVGVLDDLLDLGPKVKFLVQIVAASMLPISGLYINDLYGFMGIGSIPFWIGAPLTVFVIVFIDNAMNLIDGIDGLSGGLALISLTGFLLCFGREGLWSYCVLIAGLMGVVCSYLYFNIWGKASKGSKIFMGDSGSLSLGFILGFLVVKFAMNSCKIPTYRSDGLLLSYTLLIVPCFDVVRVVMERLRFHQPLFKADKRHIHHKLIQCGLSQHRVLAAILTLQILFVAVNMLLSGKMNITYTVIIDIAIYTTFHIIVDMNIKRKTNDKIEVETKYANIESK